MDISSQAPGASDNSSDVSQTQDPVADNSQTPAQEPVSTSSDVPTKEEPKAQDPNAPAVIPAPGAADPNASAAQAYSPNVKFKAYGKELEFEDWAKGMIKDKETEEKFRSLHAKAYGFEPLKENFDKYKQDVSPKLQEFDNVQRGINIVSKFAQSRDFDNFFASLNIPEQAVFEWFERKVEELKAPPHIQQQMKQARETSRQNLLMSYQHQDLMTQQEQHVRQNMEREVEIFSTHQEYAPIQGAYEQRAGEGSFKKLILDRIEMGKKNGENLSVAQAMQVVGGTLKQFLGVQPQAQSMTAQQSTPAAPQAPAQAPREAGKPPVLPNISGKGSSPIKAGFKNLDDMRKAAKALEKGD
jgi:hypothetical protein